MYWTLFSYYFSLHLLDKTLDYLRLFPSIDIFKEFDFFSMDNIIIFYCLKERGLALNPHKKDYCSTASGRQEWKKLRIVHYVIRFHNIDEFLVQSLAVFSLDS